MILQSVTLQFDPKTADKETREIFADDMARLLWLAIRQGHLKNQYFNRLVLQYAKTIEKVREEGKLNAELLFRILSDFAKPPHMGVIGKSEQKFAEELLPFVMGEKSITYEVKMALP